MIYNASLIKLIIKLKVKIKEQKGRNFMQRATAEKKDLLNLSETIEYFAKRDPTRPLTLPHSHIRNFDEQYEELSSIYLDVLK